MLFYFDFDFFFNFYNIIFCNKFNFKFILIDYYMRKGIGDGN